MDLLVRDALLRRLPSKPASQVAVVLIDEEALKAGGHWPWSRQRLAGLVEGTFSAGAQGVILDLLFPEPGGDDEALARALRKGPTALAVGLDEEGRWLLPTPSLQGGAMGHVSFDLDRDGVVRRFASTKQANDTSYPALPLAAARVRRPGLPIPVGLELRPGFSARPVPMMSAAAVLEGRNPGALRGRVVFIGASAAGVGDRVVSPISRGGSPDPGVVVEALSAEAILSGDLLRTVPPLPTALLVFVLGLAGAFLLDAQGPWLPWSAAGLLAAPLVLAAAALAFLHLELPALTMMASLGASGAAAVTLRFRKARQVMGAAQGRILELESLQAALAESGRQDAEARRVVAHELKTPLTSVKGLAQLLAQFELSPGERNRVAGMVASEASRLAEMVDTLLDLERLRLRDFGRDSQVLDFTALCRDRRAFLEAGTPREIQADFQDGLRLLGNKGLLERVVDNLVANAVKYSPEGTPVRMTLATRDAFAILEVLDLGPGVPAQERRAIFGRFSRGSSQGLAPGLGLGLALVAEIVAWHRGAVEADERPGGGSVFRVRLPLPSTHEA